MVRVSIDRPFIVLTETKSSYRHIPSLLTPTMQAGQDSDEGVGGLEERCPMHAMIIMCFFVLE
jgi:hypothetical protein